MDATTTLADKVKWGTLPQNIAFAAVQKEMCVSAIIEGKGPLLGPLDYGDISGSPTTKWSNRPVYVVHDHGTCTFSVAFTSDPELFDKELNGHLSDPWYGSIRSFEGELELRELCEMPSDRIREEIHMNTTLDILPEDNLRLRTVLRRRARGLTSLPGMPG